MEEANLGRMIRVPELVALATLVLFAAGCRGLRTEPADALAERAPAKDGTYMFVWLRTGSASLTPEESKACFEGHFSNIDRLADEGLLLVAGPLAEPKAQPDHRGIYIFDAPDLTSVSKLVATDPAVAAGVFVFEAEPFVTAAPLRALLADQRASAESGSDAMRSYVLASSEDVLTADEAIARLQEEGIVFLAAHIGAPGSERAFCVLDAETVADARAMLEYATGENELRWSVSPWFATESIERLAGLGLR